MSYKEALDGAKISISISESENMPALGLSEAHLVDAMCEVARHLLALGATLIYGGDLRTHGFTRLLHELVSRYRKDSADERDKTSVLNYLAWPVFLNTSIDELNLLKETLSDTAKIEILDSVGSTIPLDVALSFRPNAPIEWADGLTAMRSRATEESTARIVLGGKTDKFLGRMPGIAEEVLSSLSAKKPVFLLGGFGGCTREILDVMGIMNPLETKAPKWPEAGNFTKFNLASFNNGLTDDENQVLATTPYIDQAIILIIRGLMNLKNSNPEIDTDNQGNEECQH